ncbi:class I SAM-dependent methyltransferase [Actinomadura macrotermitis]|uniref:Ubiquinone biosynthesis O-methyltransferase n=1 Tax=Actinomadura macrotermitis TaxID=2585200 RepID=A0A7K0C2I7_9ACTN|nr:class I SAM-dependent methyltransferase [Actinomadura macrotermitis]MQY07044.1 Ubiquinone biosynthesis O-methyltransferase [Actinomadura macrotermitis]
MSIADKAPPVGVTPDHAGQPVPGLRDFYDRPATPVRSGRPLTGRLLRLLEPILREAGRPLVVADLGCGDGHTARMIRELATGLDPRHRVLGMDWAEAPLQSARGEGLTLVRGSLERAVLPFADQSLDVVVLTEVIEHLLDTDHAVAEIHRVLRPGGHLLLTTPNLAAWFNRALLLAGVQPVFSEVGMRRVYGRPGHEVAGHLHLFTRRALVGLLDAAGYADTRVSGACYHDVPRVLRGVDRIVRRLLPGWAAILVVHARRRQ